MVDQSNEALNLNNGLRDGNDDGGMFSWCSFQEFAQKENDQRVRVEKWTHSPFSRLITMSIAISAGITTFMYVVITYMQE